MPAWTPKTDHYQQTAPHIRVLYPEGNHRRVIQDGPNVPILHLVEGVNGFDAIVKQFMEHEADTSSARKLVQRKVVSVAVDRVAEFGSKFRNDGQHHATRTLISHYPSKRLQLSVVFLKLASDALFDVG